MMASAPAAARITREPAARGYRRVLRAALTSPDGVLTTTAERLPISARAIGTMFFVSSALRIKYGGDAVMGLERGFR